MSRMKLNIAYVFLLILWISIVKSQSQDECPEIDNTRECPPADQLSNECIENSDCQGSKICCGDGCELKCIAGANPPKKLELCDKPIDLGFILDSSSSIGTEKFEKLKLFVERIIDAFVIGENGTSVGVIEYSVKAEVVFDFNKFQGAELTKENVVNEIRKLTLVGGHTRIDLALELANTDLFSAKGGASKRTKIALVLTDGKQTRGDQAPDAKDLHIASAPLKNKVQIYSLGIGDDYDIGELLDIASDDTSVFRAQDFDELLAIVNNIAEDTCKGCTRAIDFHFALDSSINVGRENFQYMKNFLQAVGDDLVISETGAHVSASIFGDDPMLMFIMNEATQKQTFLDEVDQLQYIESTNGNMDRLLRMVSDDVFTLDGFTRQNAPKVLIMLTASNCDNCDERVEDAVLPLKAQGVHIITIPIGNNVNMDEINKMVSYPSNEYALPRQTFLELQTSSFLRRISNIVCAGKPGVCEEPPIEGSCPEITSECTTDMKCEGNRKCCITNCKASCELPKAACITPIDVAFAFETTRSGEADFENVKNFAANLLDHFRIGRSETHVSISTFSESTGATTYFNEEYDKSNIKQLIRDLSSDSGDRSNLGDFLESTSQSIFSVQAGLRQSTPRVLVFFTNGVLSESQSLKAQREAKILQAEGLDVSILVVNVGGNTGSIDTFEAMISNGKIFDFDASSTLSTSKLEVELAETICASKTRTHTCAPKTQAICNVKDDLCSSDFDCPGYQDCVSDGCRLRCQKCDFRCNDKLDLLFMIDSSTRIGVENFQKAKENVNKMLEWFTISPDNTNVGVITYSDTANIAMSLPPAGTNNPPQSLVDCQGRINSIPFNGGSKSNLDEALKLAAAQVFVENSDRFRKDTKKAVIVITDGVDDSTSRLDLASWPLRRQRIRIGENDYSAIHILAVSVGDELNLDKLENVVTPTLEQNVFFAANFDDMYNEIRRLVESSCEYAGAVTEPPNIYIKGDPGPPGPPGPKGDPGPDGPDGNNGNRGPKGGNGDPGSKGQKGERGFPGPPGSGGDGDDTKGPDPMANLVGAIEGTAVPGRGNIIFDLREGPVGPPGSVGKVGPIGPTGDTGEQGKKGRVGSPGLRGVFGAPGPKGESGLDGSQGLPGEPGLKGEAGKKGPTGGQGIPGPQGPFGYKGEQGVPGISGDVGDNGEKGPKGYLGEKGAQGEIGEAGYTGAEGKVGPVGSPGQRGLRGADGLSGIIGKVGLVGNNGQQGPRGNRGLKGQSGNAGPRGVKGSVGDVGSPGQQGSIGNIGAAGQDGKPGSPGDDGPIGLAGSRGIPGPPGPSGEPGPQGPVGATGLVGLKGDMGEPGTIGLTGDKGDTGSSGAAGAKGAQGQQGNPGQPGKNGPRGKQGAVGFQGLQGQTGEPGRNGQQGPKGNQGPFGERGAVGMKGSNGASGLTGTKGVTGDSGSIGKPGAPGRDGKRGIQGISGKNGNQGMPGTEGVQGLQGLSGGPGITGDVGDAGERGLSGAAGTKGSRGDSGTRGQQGAPGEQGRSGPSGFKGAQGPQGSTGGQGSPGSRGAPGLDGFFGSEGRKGSSGRPGNPGSLGEQGSPGNIGVPGPQGISGAPGESGTNGLDGASGEQGPPGSQGARGANGREGSSGLPGRQGSTGAKGKAGARGSKGGNGQDGGEGARGPDGTVGQPGQRGPRGESGADGTTGLDGSQGPTGKMGSQGKPGTPGMPGPSGLRGAVGAPGLRGPKGPSGDRGDAGEMGPLGLVGSAGALGNYGEQGFVGPIGAIGLMGETGPQGMPGRQGLPGSPGLSGVPGVTGLAGKEGTKGPIGDPGNAGAAGKVGQAGSPGKDGLPGKSGKPGSQGKQGVQGIQGPLGAQGEEGTRGAPGRQGSSGKIGPKGFQGLDGASGEQGKRGARGKEGNAGPIGPKGKDGIPGTSGVNGEEGLPGNNGPKGENGDRGESGDFGNQGDRGDAGQVGASGLKGAIGPRGRNGEAGAPGNRGGRGDMGRVGPRGASGADGKDGGKGMKGVMGQHGIQGPNGDSGEKGDIGPDGPPGYTGPKGISGDAGADGPVGPVGLKGEMGNEGQAGNRGIIGASGESGKPGTAGVPGPPGPPGPPGDMSSFLSGNYMEFVNAGGLQKGPRYYGGRSKRSLDENSNSIDKIFKKNYETFKNFDSVWNKVVDDLVMRKTLGTSKNPALTCADLFRASPYTKSGDYWIDPNDGSPDDAILVHCNATNYETCIYPRWPTFEKDSWYEGEENYMWAYWDGLLSDEEYISYSADFIQLNMIRLMSEYVRQNITFHCKNSYSDLKIKTDNNEIMNINKLSRMSMTKHDDCMVKDGKWRQAVFEMKSKYLEHFPIQDIAFKDIGGKDEEFGLDVGPVCFS